MCNRLKMLVCMVGTLVLALPPLAFSGVSGKVSGVVVEAETGEPIVGATVQVVGTQIGTTTDIDGEYFIINLPGGKYDVTVNQMGYEPVTKTGVRVLVDLTTPLDFDLSMAPVAITKEVVVTAANPIIQRDLTASRIIFTAERLELLPNITNVQSVLTNYPGVVKDRDQALHVRGGRTGQVSYYYDGFNIQDPFTSAQGLNIIPSSLEELSLTSGGYTAEYGEALSGIVSAVSPEGGQEYRGSLRMYEGFTHQYDVTKGDWGDLSSAGNRVYALDLAGPIPGMDRKKYNFSAAAQYLTDDTYLPHNDKMSWTATSKITLRPANGWKIKTNLTYYTADGSVYDHVDANGVSYDLNLDGLPVLEREAYLVGLTSDYAFSEKTVLSGSISRFHTSRKIAPEHLFDTHWSKWPGYSEDADGNYNGTIHEETYRSDVDYSDPAQVVGFTVGDDYDPTFNHNRTYYNAINVRLLNQFNKWNQFKIGGEYRRYEISRDFKQFYNSFPYGERYKSKPTYASFFVQDKMEYDYFIVNLGLRYDYHNADIEYNITPGEFDETWKEADSKHKISPRLGVSFPITENSVMHFNYGVYYQYPRFTYLYINYQGDVRTGLPLLGNPDLEPEETTAYELGIDHLINEDFRLTATAYYKDVKELVTARPSGSIQGQTITKLDNDDYGSVKGVDMSLEMLPSGGFFSGSVSYGYMIATGNGSYALEPYYTYIHSTTDPNAPVTEYPLDFDQRHTVTAVMSYRVPSEWDGRFLGQRIPGDWGVTAVGYYGSGLPYSPTDNTGNRLGERNEARLPAHYTVDLRVNKDFRFGGGNGQRLSLFVEVDNLFDRRNVVDLYTNTGLPDNDGTQPGAGLALNQEELDYYDRLYDHDPQNYSPPRTIRTGLEFHF